MHKLFDDGFIAFLPVSPNVVENLLGKAKFPTRGNFPSYPDSAVSSHYLLLCANEVYV
jgi:hypothetical protein